MEHPRFFSVAFFFWAVLLLGEVALGAGSEIRGLNLLNQETITVKPGAKGTVVVFLSAECPCSQSHVPLLKKMAGDFPHFTFVGVHANANEPPSKAREYFTAVALPFPVMEDSKAELADQFRALKTPHAFLLDPTGKILYRGGVTNSADSSRADVPFLTNALTDVENNRAVRTAAGRTLGCLISRTP